ncbi:MAG: Mrp/NBP35 family ATP-binding protein [Bacteroidetes bacterium]|nr:Mrp/NBP35 family ATP-binding protein [Bacteroidota bacterium]
MISNEQVLKALSHVDDPDLKKDLVTLGMIENLQIDESIRFDLVLTTPACPMKDMMVNACKNAIRLMVDAAIPVEIHTTSRVSTTRTPDEVLRGVKNIIAVASGKGGVGKSTVSAGLALALQQMGAAVGLLDADIYGPSIPTIFGVHESPEMKTIDGRQVMIPIEKFGIRLLSIGFMTPPEQAIVWRGPMIASAFRQFVNDTDWGDLDYLIIDLPPGTGDVQLSLAQIVPLTGLVIVTTPQEVAIADARRAVSMFRIPAISKPILGVVENMAWFEPPDMPGKKYFIFGEGGGKRLAEEQQVPYLGALPLTESVRVRADKGSWDATAPDFQPFMVLAAEVARQVSIENSHKSAKFV